LGGEGLYVLDEPRGRVVGDGRRSRSPPRSSARPVPERYLRAALGADDAAV